MLRTPGLIPIALVVGGLFLSSPEGVEAQDAPRGLDPALGLTLGTSGIGVEGSVRFGARLGVRVGASWIPVEPEIEEEDVRGEASLPSPILRLTADYFPWGGTFHLSAGVAHFTGGISGHAVPTQNVELDGNEYTPEQIGELRGTIWGSETAPYFGLGWLRSSGRIQPYFELGAAWTGSPEVEIEVLGPAGQNPTLLADLDAEIRRIEEDAESFKAYPILVLGFRVRLGG